MRSRSFIGGPRRGSGPGVSPTSRCGARAHILGALVIAAGLGSIACDEPCGGNVPADLGEAPVIESVELLRQLEGDPWTLIFGVSFVDSDGNVGTGKINLYVGSSDSATSMEAADRFGESGVALDSTRGRFAMTPRFSETVQDGQEVELSTQLVDAAGNHSNCFRLTMDFAVRTVTE